ncbi:exo-beta-N-acetylmuramidase NamZ domain-containing protein [Melioribacteraceae bacterium 4301-Me]|uniref:exo-beta-N-acetylmuramidase NamZ family protein n=1 Tax=Pyranulibacter aquaticus TaxID=3163344 RepID=UPI00359637B5
MKNLLIILICLSLSSILIESKNKDANKTSVVTGADVLLTEKIDLLKGKHLGLVVNHSSLLSDGTHIVDALYKQKEVKIVALFGPEHGVRGDTTGAIENAVDAKTGIPVYSLYGKTYKPTPEMLKGIDLLVFDIQDVGARFYTFISTLGLVMEAAAENHIPIIVLDRPNPIAGLYVDGPVTEDTLKSFVAFAPIPITYGLTIGELAKMYNESGWLKNKVKADLTVIKMKNWKRNMWYNQTGLTWIKPSPNMPFLSTAIVYPGTCLFEGTNVSEGRGTEKPFEYIGASWLDADKVINELKKVNLQGVSFEPIEFTPQWFKFNAHPPKYYNEKCNGIYVHVIDRNKFESVKTGVALLWAIKKVHSDKFEWRKTTIDRLAGTSNIRLLIDEGKTPNEIFNSWESGLENFKKIRGKYLLYK